MKIHVAILSVVLAAILGGIGWTLTEVINLKVAVAKNTPCDCSRIARSGP